MRIAAILSGTVREPEKSLASLKLLKANNDVHVFAHLWSNIEDTIANSWSHKQPHEPTAELIDKYAPIAYNLEDWTQKKPEFDQIIANWLTTGPLTESMMIARVGLLGQYWSLHRAWFGARQFVQDYDMVIRLRTDTFLIDDPTSLRASGWFIPNVEDFGGINDQLGWYWVDKGSLDKTIREIDAYFDLFGAMDCLIKQGCYFHPETLLARNFHRLGVNPSRVAFRYTIR